MSLPEFLIENLKNQYGEEITEKIIDGYSKKRYTTLRVNSIKTNKESLIKELQENNIEFEKVSWYDDAFIIKNVREKEIQELNAYQNGEIYLQSLSSMLPPVVLNPQEGMDILDMAAAPGGKTTQMAALSNNKAHITACELNKIRAEKLKFNIEKQGASCVYIMPKDSRNLDDFFSFDQILLDAPCSGSGTLNINDANLLKYFTEVLVKKSVTSQLALLRKAVKVLKKGREMVYSTCSILAKENEEVVEKVLRENRNLEIVTIEFDGISELPLLPTKIPGTLCVAPTELYEGFYVAKIRKK